MTISLGILILTYLVLLLMSKYFRAKIVDAYFLIMSPYVFIIIINNLVMVETGFDVISDRIIYIHVLGILLFYVGAFGGECLMSKMKFKPLFKPTMYENISLKKLIVLTFFLVVAVGLGKSLLIYKYGLIGFISGGDSIKMFSIFNHLILLLYPCTMMLCDYALKERKRYYYVLVALAIFLVFSSFIKYHIISLLISIFIYIIIRKPKYFIKCGIATLALIVTSFVINYMLDFMSNDIQVENQFYYNHLWQYVGGSTIVMEYMENYIGNNSNYSIIEWLWGMVTSFPTIFTKAFFDTAISDYDFSTTLPMVKIGNASGSNVVGILGSAFLQGNMLSFSLFMIGWGMIVQFVVTNLNQRNTNTVAPVLVGSIFLSFNILSFFSSFFVLSNPWETMLCAAILPSLIKNRSKQIKMI